MAFPNLSTFKEAMRDGGARPSLFEMTVVWPSTLVALSTDAALNVPFHCRMAELPGTSVNPLTVKYAGREIKYAAARVYANMQITILNDEGFKVRKGLERWFESMNTRDTNQSLLTTSTGVGADSYGGTGEVWQYSKTGSKVRGYRLVEMFPVNLSPIALDWSNDAAIEEYTCEFAYQYWEPLS